MSAVGVKHMSARMPDAGWPFKPASARTSASCSASFARLAALSASVASLSLSCSSMADAAASLRSSACSPSAPVSLQTCASKAGLPNAPMQHFWQEHYDSFGASARTYIALMPCPPGRDALGVGLVAVLLTCLQTC